MKILRFFCLGLVALCFLIQPLYAALPDAPDIQGLTVLTKPRTLWGDQKIGTIELVSGHVRVIPEALDGFEEAKIGLALVRGDHLSTEKGSRVRVRLKGGDILHLGGESLVRLHRNNGLWTAHIWRGSMMVYGLPSLMGKKLERSIVLPDGMVKLSLGKTGLSVHEDRAFVHAFNSRVMWEPDRGERLEVGFGKTLVCHLGDVAPVKQGLEKTYMGATSPESLKVAEGIEAYSNKEYEQAVVVLKSVQEAFPYNGMVPYYLGLSYLAQENLADTIRQWRRYEKIDPLGAKKNDIPKHLTVLIAKRMKVEIQEALANEDAMSAVQVEPNSIAIPPFANKGDEKFKILAKGITAMIIADLAKVPGVKVLERAKMQKLVDEIELSKSGLVSEDTSVRAGRIMKADKLIIGDYSIE